jgi:ferrous iron transport protein A
LRIGDSAVIDRLELPEEIAMRLMQMGMIPGCTVEAAHAAPAGDPMVYRVDGTEIALRRETSNRIQLVSVPA